MQFHLAQLNVARLRWPLDAPQNTEFMAVLEAVNAIAEVSPGFVWRLKDESGRSSTYITATHDPQLIVNMTMWEDIESLRHFTYRSGHGAYFRRRREWFEPAHEINAVCWWIPTGEIPSLGDAMSRLGQLRANGSTPCGFALGEELAPPADGPVVHEPSGREWAAGWSS